MVKNNARGIEMGYKIVVDSCCELPKELKKDERFESVPLTLIVGDVYEKEDDENFDQKEFLEITDIPAPLLKSFRYIPASSTKSHAASTPIAEKYRFSIGIHSSKKRFCIAGEFRPWMRSRCNWGATFRNTLRS